VGTIKNRRRKTKWDRTETEIQGSRDRTNHLLDRVSAIENAIVRLHGVRCPCGSRETIMCTGGSLSGDGSKVINSITTSTGTHDVDHIFGEIRCFYCHRLLEAYGVMG